MSFQSFRSYNNPLAKLLHRSEMRRLLSALFHPNDLVEIRAIANRRDESPTASALKARVFDRACNLAQRFDALTALNQTSVNIYFGVNPRTSRHGRKSAVQCCRSVWVDLDHITVEEAQKRIANVLPKPSLMVDSGHGVHLYYLLEQEVRLTDPRTHDNFEATLKGFYRAFGADATQDVSRLLRLPGFLNVKRGQVPCSLVSYAPTRRFSFEEFTRFRPVPPPKRMWKPVMSGEIQAHSEINAIRTVLRKLEEDSGDRSRRDFAAICHLLRIGLPTEEIWTLVEGRSKFATDGRRYFDHTVANAIRRLQES